MATINEIISKKNINYLETQRNDAIFFALDSLNMAQKFKAFRRANRLKRIIDEMQKYIDEFTEK